MIRVTDAIGLDERDIEERFVRSSGPGGQNVNKVSTAVELRFDVRASSLPPGVKARLAVLAGRRLTPAGILVIDSRTHRTQAHNRRAAFFRLLDLVKRAAAPPVPRRPTTPGRAAREQRLSAKKRHGQLKAARQHGARDDD